MYKIALFASGSGSNVENIANYFSEHSLIQVGLVLSNKKDAFVLERAKRLGIPSMVFNREQFYQSNSIVNTLVEHDIDWVILAGFLWLIPANLIDAFPQRIVNIHPALLPKFGGKGMYGDKVHEAVVENHETESGITIHYVNEHYDRGNIIFQARVKVLPPDTPNEVAQKVHQLEYQYYPQIIESLVLGKEISKD